jgi:hypothetical protein
MCKVEQIHVDLTPTSFQGYAFSPVAIDSRVTEENGNEITQPQLGQTKYTIKHKKQARKETCSPENEKISKRTYVILRLHS